jgi:predicted DCC family thiol-disulfide oxidoreductase YuxK
MNIKAELCETLFYDGQCQICSVEIAKLKRLADADIQFQDINSLNQSPEERERLFSQLHLRKADGRWLTGLDANIAAWQHTRWRHCVGVLRFPVINTVARLGYGLWLKWYQNRRKIRQSRAS